MRPYTALDYVIIGEPELTLRDLLDHLEQRIEDRSEYIQENFYKMDPSYQLAIDVDGEVDLIGI